MKVETNTTPLTTLTYTTAWLSGAASSAPRTLQSGRKRRRPLEGEAGVGSDNSDAIASDSDSDTGAAGQADLQEMVSRDGAAAEAGSAAEQRAVPPPAARRQAPRQPGSSSGSRVPRQPGAQPTSQLDLSTLWVGNRVCMVRRQDTPAP